MRAALLVVAGVFAVACQNEEIPCVENLQIDCDALYDPPEYQTIFEKILHPKCSIGNGNCHTADGAKKGLVFEDADAAYQLLTAPADTDPRVIRGDPHCSLIVERLYSDDPDFRMPPGPEPLSPEARCTIVKWIADGANR